MRHGRAEQDEEDEGRNTEFEDCGALLYVGMGLLVHQLLEMPLL